MYSDLAQWLINEIKLEILGNVVSGLFLVIEW